LATNGAMTAVKSHGLGVAGAPATQKKKGGPSPEREIMQLEAFLREIKIEATGTAEMYQILADAVYEAVNVAVERLVEGLGLKIFECDEEPDSVNYARGIGFSWTSTTWCIGVVRSYHIIAEVTEGYNASEGKAKLESIWLVKGDPDQRGVSE
jgi:hypothetical protein